MPQVFDNLGEDLALGDPQTLFRRVLIDELMGDRSFRGVLAPLKETMSAHFDAVFSGLSSPDVSASPGLPERVRVVNPSLESTLVRVLELVAYCRWRVEESDEVATAFRDFFGSENKPPSSAETSHADPSLWGQLHLLKRVVEHSQPISVAREKLGRLTDEVNRHRKEGRTLKAYERGQAAFQELESLGGVVDAVVGGLLNQLGDGTKKWMTKLYQPANVGGPQFQGCHLSDSDALEMRAGTEGVAAPLHQISNASALRASLLSFLFAYRTHLLAERGGLNLLLLDDPQELFDPENRKRLTGTMRALLKTGTQLVVTTNDPTFVRSCRQIRNRQQGRLGFYHRLIHPPSQLQGTLCLTPTKQDRNPPPYLTVTHPRS